MKINQFIATAALLVSSAVVNPWIECGIGSVMESPFEKQSALSNPDICANKETAADKLINDT